MEETKFEKELANLINKHSLENGSGTPDYILAQYLSACLKVFSTIVKAREDWYGRKTNGTFSYDEGLEEVN